ncbi:MAG TPA: glycosyltransferase family 2 protein [Pyrinomonadaceae bacterium]
MSVKEQPLISKEQPLVSVVLLSYNRPALLQEALASLLGQSHGHLEITVVDNPSPASADVARIVGQHRGVRLAQNQVNLGYAGGMNTGINQASGDYVFLTEDDIVLDSDCLRHLVNYMDAQPSAALIAPIVYNKTERTIRCAGGDFALGGVYRKRTYGAGERDTGQFARPFAVGYIDGATMFARRDFWQRFKGFRAEYFMYVEAVELCARVLKSGHGMAVVPQAKVYHFDPPDEATPPEIEFHKIKNFFSLYLLHAPARHLPEFVCRYAIINGARSLTGRSGSPPRAFLKALWWAARNAPSLLKERRAQT